MVCKAYAAGDKGASRGTGREFLARSGDRLERSRAWGQRLEGSRFTTRQLYRYLAGGSRGWPRTRIGSRLIGLRLRTGDEALGFGTPGVVPGSRLQPSYITAKRQSGSPPGPGPGRELVHDSSGYRYRPEMRRWVLARQGLFPGAACSQAI